jgi:hypothetical protein
MHLRAAGRANEAEEHFKKSLTLRYTWAAVKGLEALAKERAEVRP